MNSLLDKDGKESVWDLIDWQAPKLVILKEELTFLGGDEVEHASRKGNRVDYALQ